MGAVKRIRHKYICFDGEDWICPLCEYEKRIKKEKRIFQQHNIPFWGSNIGFNNRRKMAGLPMRRIHRH